MQPSTSTNKLPVLIIDTNIFGNLLDQKTIEDTWRIITELKSSYQLSVSNITLQEIISKGTKDVNGILKILAGFRRFEIDEKVLIFGGLMSCVGIKGNFDSIIASTVFLNNAFLLTANQRDFPEPCFKESKNWVIKYKDSGNRTAYRSIYLLTVDAEKTANEVGKVEFVQEVRKPESGSR